MTAIDDRTGEELLTEVEAEGVGLAEADDLGFLSAGETGSPVIPGSTEGPVYPGEVGEQHFRFFVESMSEGAATLAADSTVMYCNTRLASLLEIPIHKLTGARLDRWVAPADLPRFTKLLAQSLEENCAWEMDLLNGAGLSVPVHFCCRPLKLGGRNSTSAVVTDLSEQKRSEDLAADDMFSRSIIEQAAEVILVCDKNGRIIRDSLLAGEICGQNPLRHQFADLFRLQITRSDQFYSLAAPLDGETCKELEVEFTRKEGDVCHFLLSAGPLLGRQQQIVGCMVTMIDITGRKQADNLRFALNTINDLIHSTFDFDQIMNQVVSEAAKVLGSETATIFLNDGEDWKLSYSHGPIKFHGTRLSRNEEPHTLLAVQTRKPVVVSDTHSDLRVDRRHMEELGVRALMVIPLLMESKVIGLFCFQFGNVFTFHEYHSDFAEKLAASLSLAIENASLFKKLQVELAERKRVEQELLRIHDELEQRVVIRTSELELSRDRYSNLYDLAPLAYITLDSGGTIREINLTGAALLGCDREELVGKHFVAHVRKENVRLFYGHMQRCRNNRKQVTSELYLRLHDDSLLPVLLQSVPVADSGGGEILYRTAVTDIGERKQAEEKLLRMNRLYVMLSRTNEAIVRAPDQNNLFREVCQICVTLGGFRMAWIGLIDCRSHVVLPVASYGTGMGLVDGIEISDSHEAEQQAMVGKAISRGDFHISNETPGAASLAADGLVTNAVASAAFALKLNGETVGALALYADEANFFDEQMVELLQQMAADISFALDNFDREARQWAAERALQKEISERLRTVEELRKKEQLLTHQSRRAAMGEMIGNISHQWRQPLNVLGLVIQEMPYRYETGELTGEYLSASVDKAKQLIFHMSQTIDDFRNFFRPEKEKVLFRVHEVVRKTISLIDASFKQQLIVLNVIIESEQEIYGYPNEFSQVLLNILLNAKDAFSDSRVEKRKVQVLVLSQGSRAVVTVEDNAGGIPDSIFGQIFDPYFTTKGPDKGTGLGLFMSKVIIEKNMNGRLSVCNTEEGARFTILI